MDMLITPWHRAHDMRLNRSQLVPIEFKSGPSYVKHIIRTSAFIVMMVPFINLHTKLTVQVLIYFIYVASYNKLKIWKLQP